MRIRMTAIGTCLGADGNRYVFGPSGREYDTNMDPRITDDMAKQLIDKQCAESLDPPTRSRRSKPFGMTQEDSEDG